MQAHVLEVSLAKIVIIYPFKNLSLLLPSHNCIIISSMFSFQGAIRPSSLRMFRIHPVSFPSVLNAQMRAASPLKSKPASLGF